MALTLLPKTTHIPFLKFRTPAIGLSVVFLLLTLVLLFVKGLSFGIDFTGGALIQLQVPNVQVSDVRQTLNDAHLDGFSIQEFGAADEFLLRLPLEDGKELAHTTEEIQKALPTAELRRTEFVGPQIGEELRRDGLLAVLVSLAAILVYISMRFELRYGLGAIAALVHDVMLTVGVFALLQKEVSLTVLAAVLTIIGYSLNDTIVVFDRIRENRQKSRKEALVKVLDTSLNQTLSRTIMTTLTTLLVLVCLFLFGGEVIHDFAFTLLFGVVVGTYSSIFIASPVLLAMEGYYKRLEAEQGKQGTTHENP